METGRRGLSQELSGLSLQREPPGGDRSDHEQNGLLPSPGAEADLWPPRPPSSEMRIPDPGGAQSCSAWGRKASFALRSTDPGEAGGGTSPGCCPGEAPSMRPRTRPAPSRAAHT